MSHTNHYFDTLQTVTFSINNLINILNKLPEFIESNKSSRGTYLISEDYILSSRIAPDMFPLSRQIQIVSDMSKGLAGRLGNIDAPKFDDTETTVAELITRLQKTLDFINSIKTEDIQNSDNRIVILPFMPTKSMSMGVYVNNFAMPNIYFHTITTYNILRSLGLNIGKMDFIGHIKMEDVTAE